MHSICTVNLCTCEYLRARVRVDGCLSVIVRAPQGGDARRYPGGAVSRSCVVCTKLIGVQTRSDMRVWCKKKRYVAPRASRWHRELRQQLFHQHLRAGTAPREECYRMTRCIPAVVIIH